MSRPPPFRLQPAALPRGARPEPWRQNAPYALNLLYPPSHGVPEDLRALLAQLDR